jgi:hypothetical protein
MRTNLTAVRLCIKAMLTKIEMLINTKTRELRLHGKRHVKQIAVSKNVHAFS